MTIFRSEFYAAPISIIHPALARAPGFLSKKFRIPSETRALHHKSLKTEAAKSSRNTEENVKNVFF
jgi:hypothetical protein